MSGEAKLTKEQCRMLKAIASAPALVPYGDTVASSLLLGGLAQRVTAFGKLKITAAGRDLLLSQNKDADHG